MTLQEFFTFLAQHPGWLLSYFALLPFTALIAGWLGKGEGHLAPWKYLYSILIYATSIPGIFAITLNIYLFVFERKSILQTDLYTQIIPIIAMIATLLIIRRNVDLRQVPGFDWLSGLVMMLSAVFILLWIIEKTRIFAISIIPFHYVILLFAILFLAVRLGWGKLRGSQHP